MPRWWNNADLWNCGLQANVGLLGGLRQALVLGKEMTLDPASSANISRTAAQWCDAAAWLPEFASALIRDGWVIPLPDEKA